MAARTNIERYEELKLSVRALRSELRPRSLSVTVVNPGPPSDSPRQDTTVLSNYSQDSATAQLLNLHFQIQQEEWLKEKIRLTEKLKEKVRQIDMMKIKYEKQKQRLEAKHHHYEEQLQIASAQTCEEVAKLEKELEVQKAVTITKEKEYAEKIEASTLLLEHDFNFKFNEIERAKGELQVTLENVLVENEHLKQKTKALELELSSTKKDLNEKFAINDEEWKLKLQHLNSKLQALNRDLVNERIQNKRQSEEYDRRFNEYKLQKVQKIDVLENHIKIALAAKDTTINQLRFEFQKLQQYIEQTVNVI